MTCQQSSSQPRMQIVVIVALVNMLRTAQNHLQKMKPTVKFKFTQIDYKCPWSSNLRLFNDRCSFDEYYVIASTEIHSSCRVARIVVAAPQRICMWTRKQDVERNEMWINFETFGVSQPATVGDERAKVWKKKETRKPTWPATTFFIMPARSHQRGRSDTLNISNDTTTAAALTSTHSGFETKM